MRKLLCVLLLAALMCTLASCADTRAPRAGNYILLSVEGPSKPNVILDENGGFTFVFSAYGSNVYFGNYSFDDGRLTLLTSDGLYTYIFDVQGKNLVFDADASSAELWGADIKDGDVFSYIGGGSIGPAPQ